MTSDDLIDEMRVPQVKGVAVAFLDLVAWRTRLVMEMREETGERGLTLLDLNVSLYVFTFGLFDGPGARASEIIDTFGAPRRTIRDSLKLLERAGLIVRERGLYYPTQATAFMFNRTFEARYRFMIKLCEGFTTYQRAIESDRA